MVAIVGKFDPTYFEMLREVDVLGLDCVMGRVREGRQMERMERGSLSLVTSPATR
jgi:hypothetical protein